jgi:glycosyltransferase involved in cell wall biosynthesis
MKRTIAYLIHTFPAYSQTFIADEIQSLQEKQRRLALFAVFAPQPQDRTPDYAPLQEQTTYISPMSLPLLLFRHLQSFVGGPGKYCGTLWYAATRGRLSPGRRAHLLVQFLRAIYFYPMLRACEAVHLHVHFMMGSAAIALLLHRRYGISYSITAHGYGMFVQKLLLGEKIRHARFVRVATEYNRRHLLKFAPERGESIRVIPFGIDTARSTAKPKATRNDGFIQVLSVGRLTWEKAHGLLLRAFAEAHRENPRLRLTIAGDGPLREELLKTRQALGLDRVVVLPGSIAHEQIGGLYDESDIFVLSSVSEGFGVVLLEAMARRLPVIAPALNGIPEIVADGSGGWLFPTGDDKKLAERIVTLAGDPGMRRRMGNAGYQRVRLCFNHESTCSQFDEHLLRTIEIRSHMEQRTAV